MSQGLIYPNLSPTCPLEIYHFLAHNSFFFYFILVKPFQLLRQDANGKYCAKYKALILKYGPFVFSNKWYLNNIYKKVLKVLLLVLERGEVSSWELNWPVSPQCLINGPSFLTRNQEALGNYLSLLFSQNLLSSSSWELNSAQQPSSSVTKCTEAPGSSVPEVTELWV